MENTLLTVRETAKMLTIKESTVYRWLFDKKIRPVKIGTRMIRIPKAEVERILAEGQVGEENR